MGDPDGKHGVPGVQSLCCIVRRGKPDRLIGTAKCGPACTVMWEPRLILTVSRGDPIGSRPFVSISVDVFAMSYACNLDYKAVA